MKIIPHDWKAFVDRNLFEQLLVSAAGVPITYLLVSGSEAQPAWLVLNPALSVLCFCFAFLRVWKSAKEEFETADVWESLEDTLGRPYQKIDLIIEPVYIFSLFLMPFFSVSFQFFAGLVALFYITDLFYNGMMLNAMPEYYKTQGYNDLEIENCPVRRYLNIRQVLDAAGLVFIILLGVVAWTMAIRSNFDGSIAAGLACIISLLVIEGIIEPFANIDFHYNEDIHSAEQIKVNFIAREESLSEDIRYELERIHNEAFLPEERHFDVDYFLKNNGRDGYRLCTLILEKAVIGYVFYQIIAERNIAVFWYMAIDEMWRSHGFGKTVIRNLLKEMDSNPASIRYALLESHSPDMDALSDDMNRKRIELYRSLGAYWVRGIDYAVPSHTDSDQSIRYEILFFPVSGGVDDAQVKQAVRYLTDDAYPSGDSRAAKIEESLDQMYIQQPPKS